MNDPAASKICCSPQKCDLTSLQKKKRRGIIDWYNFNATVWKPVRSQFSWVMIHFFSEMGLKLMSKGLSIVHTSRSWAPWPKLRAKSQLLLGEHFIIRVNRLTCSIKGFFTFLSFKMQSKLLLIIFGTSVVTEKLLVS